jgi:ribosomal protein L40E
MLFIIILLFLMRQKICKNCNAPNPIRCYVCKECITPFEIKSTSKDDERIKAKSKKLENLFKKQNVPKAEVIVTEKVKKEQNDTPQFSQFLQSIFEYSSIIINTIDHNQLNLFVIDDNATEFRINLPNQDVAFGYCSHFVSYKNSILGSLSYFNSLLNDTILVSFTLLQEGAGLRSQNIIATKMNSANVTYKSKYLANSNLLFFYFDRSIFVYQYDSTLRLILTIKLYSDINDLDVIFTGDGLADLKLIVSDSSYNIGLYYIKFNNNILQSQLIAIYENHFSSKITGLNFMFNYCDQFDNIIVNYFCACSKDGNLKIFSTKKTEPVYKYKTTEIWITRMAYDYHNHIIYFMVNYKEKVFGIKFNHEKEPFIKRLPETEGGIICSLDNRVKYLYLYTSDGKIKSINSQSVSEMFRTYKLKNKKEMEITDVLYNKESLDTEPLSLQVCHLEQDFLILNTITSIIIFNIK